MDNSHIQKGEKQKSFPGAEWADKGKRVRMSWLPLS